MVTFFDREELSNSINGMSIGNQAELDNVLEKLADREPFFFELLAENDYKLLVGFSNTVGCSQHSPANGDSPYLVAIAPTEQVTEDHFEFLMGGTPTPISKHYCMFWEQVRQITAHFLKTGDLSPDFLWEEI